MTKRTWMALAVGLGMVWSFASAQAAEAPATQPPASSQQKDVKPTTVSHRRAQHHRRSSTKPAAKPATAGQKMPAGGAPVAK